MLNGEIMPWGIFSNTFGSGKLNYKNCWDGRILDFMIQFLTLSEWTIIVNRNEKSALPVLLLYYISAKFYLESS